MTGATRRQRELFDGPSVYRIRVAGRLTDELSGRVAHLTLDVVAPEGEAPVSIVQAELPDQAALAGVLEMLYELHVPILSVELVAGPTSQFKE
jgi:hypothetical protein